MPHQEKNQETPPNDEIALEHQFFELPKRITAAITVVSLPLIFFCIYSGIQYFYHKELYPSPTSMGLGGVFLFSMAALFLVWLPWKRLGVRITKIGGIEFAQIINEQATEHAEEISYLEERIEALENHIRNSESELQFTELFQETPLRELLLKFLNQYSDWAFSPSRIKKWGSQQQGYKQLDSYEHALIRRTLQKMLTEGILETRVSRKGNTLYRITNN